jgi:hypothetical protein
MILKNKFGKTRVGKVLNTVLTIADNAVLAGAVSNYVNKDEDAPEGVINWPRLVGQAAVLILAIGLLRGCISIDDFGAAVEAVK